ncbi:hypothetical protein GF345_05390 [Candidatus Woesearchaeota archaeon]|nr:hypothetical protein [Candidatus Woesearchaeota archaeon]
MLNLKKSHPNLKGRLGETIAQFHIKHSFKPTDDLILEKMTKKWNIDKEKLEFIKSNKWTLDLIKFDLEDNPNSIIIYEVKLINYPQHPDYPKALKITSNELNVLKSAKKKGIDVKVVKIMLFDNWEYNLKIYDFEPHRFIICDAGKYSKPSKINI